MTSLASRAQPTSQGLGSQKLLPIVDHGVAGLGCSTKNIHNYPTVGHKENLNFLSTVLQLLIEQGSSGAKSPDNVQQRCTVAGCRIGADAPPIVMHPLRNAALSPLGSAPVRLHNLKNRAG